MDGSDRTPLETVTHARLRARQGDVAAARRIVAEILRVEPSNGPAADLLRELATLDDRASSADPTPAPLPPPVPGDPDELASRFRRRLRGRGGPGRAERLERWLRTIRRNRGDEYAG